MALVGRIHFNLRTLLFLNFHSSEWIDEPWVGYNVAQKTNLQIPYLLRLASLTAFDSPQFMLLILKIHVNLQPGKDKSRVRIMQNKHQCTRQQQVLVQLMFM